MEYLLSSGWMPPWTTCTPQWGHVVIVQRPSGLSLLIEAPAPLSRWLASYLRFWRTQIEATRVSQMATFFYLVLGQDPTGTPPTLDLRGIVVERGFGVTPSAPEEWPERELVSLIDHALRFLDFDFDNSQ